MEWIINRCRLAATRGVGKYPACVEVWEKIQRQLDINKRLGDESVLQQLSDVLVLMPTDLIDIIQGYLAGDVSTAIFFNQLVFAESLTETDNLQSKWSQW